VQGKTAIFKKPLLGWFMASFVVWLAIAALIS
jgi:hypothetical protein